MGIVHRAWRLARSVGRSKCSSCFIIAFPQPASFLASLFSLSLLLFLVLACCADGCLPIFSFCTTLGGSGKVHMGLSGAWGGVWAISVRSMYVETEKGSYAILPLASRFLVNLLFGGSCHGTIYTYFHRPREVGRTDIVRRVPAALPGVVDIS